MAHRSTRQEDWLSERRRWWRKGQGRQAMDMRSQIGPEGRGRPLIVALDRLAATPAGDTGALAGLARQARERILATVMPALVADAVAAAYLDLGDGVPVVVRSSATAEDLPFASFAGQQDTYLNIVGVEAVLDAVHRCWASLWTA